jgi:hypothetical protein
MKTQRHKNLIEEHNHITTVNRMAPFPLFDTEYVSYVEEQIQLINDNYDS